MVWDVEDNAGRERYFVNPSKKPYSQIFCEEQAN